MWTAFVIMYPMSENARVPWQPVVFRRSWPGRLEIFLKIMFASAVFQVGAAALIWGFIGATWFGGHFPVWLHVFGAVVLLLLPLITWALFNLAEPTKLVLYEDVIRIGGLLVKRIIRYEDVGVVELEAPDELFTRSLRLLIRLKRGEPRQVCLPKLDALACFHALREICPQAAAIAFDEMYEPMSEHHIDEGREALGATLLQKARWELVVAIALALSGAGLLMATHMLWGSTSGRSLMQMFVYGLLMVLAGLGTGLHAVLLRRRRRVLLDAPELDFYDYDDEDNDQVYDDYEIDHTAAGTR